MRSRMPAASDKMTTLLSAHRGHIERFARRAKENKGKGCNKNPENKRSTVEGGRKGGTRGFTAVLFLPRRFAVILHDLSTITDPNKPLKTLPSLGWTFALIGSSRDKEAGIGVLSCGRKINMTLSWLWNSPRVWIFTTRWFGEGTLDAECKLARKMLFLGG
jgi:hypothetical protein